MACAVLLALGACGDERALVVRLETEALAGATLCLTAVGEGELVFAEPYAAAEASGTLTFLAGDRVDQRLRVGARLRRGGRTIAASGGEGRFGPGGSSELALRVRRCTPPSGNPATSLGSVVGATHVLAADLDGDGRDEVIAETPTGLVVLGGAALTEDPAALLAVGDVDGDCLDDVLASDAEGLVELPSATRRSAPADHAVLADAGRGPGLATGDADGLRWGAVDGVMRTLTGQPVRGLAAGDLDADGADDLVAVGEGGVAVFLGGDAGPVAAVGAAPTGWAGRALALLDLDGDGALDLALADDARVRFARNRGDGLFEARAEIEALGVRALAVFDVDGDCRDDLVVIGDTTQIWLGAEDARPSEGPALGAWVDVVAADVDGDGARELVVLDSSGEVRTWAP